MNELRYKTRHIVRRAFDFNLSLSLFKNRLSFRFINASKIIPFRLIHTSRVHNVFIQNGLSHLDICAIRAIAETQMADGGLTAHQIFLCRLLWFTCRSGINSKMKSIDRWLMFQFFFLQSIEVCVIRIDWRRSNRYKWRPSPPPLPQLKIEQYKNYAIINWIIVMGAQRATKQCSYKHFNVMVADSTLNR